MIHRLHNTKREEIIGYIIQKENKGWTQSLHLWVWWARKELILRRLREYLQHRPVVAGLILSWQLRVGRLLVCRLCSCLRSFRKVVYTLSVFFLAAFWPVSWSLIGRSFSTTAVRVPPPFACRTGLHSVPLACTTGLLGSVCVACAIGLVFSICVACATGLICSVCVSCATGLIFSVCVTCATGLLFSVCVAGATGLLCSVCVACATGPLGCPGQVDSVQNVAWQRVVGQGGAVRAGQVEGQDVAAERHPHHHHQGGEQPFGEAGPAE